MVALLGLSSELVGSYVGRSWGSSLAALLLYCFMFAFDLSVYVGRLAVDRPLRRTPVGGRVCGGVIPEGKESR